MNLLHVIAQSCQINCRIERTNTCGSIHFCKDKVVGNFAATQVNELKNTHITVFKFTF